MEQARIVLVEDSDSIRQLLREELTEKGHLIVREASAPYEADRVADELASRRLQADFVVLDGNLTPDSYDSLHAVRFVERLQIARVFPGLLDIIVFSGNDQLPQALQINDIYKAQKPAIDTIPFIIEALQETRSLTRDNGVSS